MQHQAKHMTGARTIDGFVLVNVVTIIDSGRAASGTDYFKFADNDRVQWLPRVTCCPDPAEAISRLKQAGILVIGPKNRASLLEQALEINSFPPLNIIEHTGHYEGCFGYPDGRVFTEDTLAAAASGASVGDGGDDGKGDDVRADGEREGGDGHGRRDSGNDASRDGVEPPIAYTKHLLCVESRGTRKQWSDMVMGLLVGQHVPVFSVLMTLATPLLSRSQIQGNYLIMYSGPPRKGKSTTIAAAASVCGPAMDSVSGRRYLRRFNQTMNGIEEQLPLYRDLPMIIDELSSFGTQKSRIDNFRTLVHHIAGGDGRERFGDALGSGSHVRTIVQLTSNDQGSELLSMESEDAADAVFDRLIEIPVPRGDEGVFNCPHPDFADTNALATEVGERLSRYYGTAMPAFLKKLMVHQAQDGDQLIRDIRYRIEEFKSLPAVVQFGAVSSRVLDLFGLAYAAGRLAMHYRVIPDAIDCEAAVVHCLGLYLGRRVEVDPVQQLLAWISANPTIDLRTGRLPALSKASLAKRGAFIADGRAGPQLWMHPDLFHVTFTSSRAMVNRLHARGVLLAEGKGKHRHFSIKRTVRRREKPERVMVFQLPDFEEWLDQNGMPCPAKRRK